MSTDGDRTLLDELVTAIVQGCLDGPRCRVKDNDVRTVPVVEIANDERVGTRADGPEPDQAQAGRGLLEADNGTVGGQHEEVGQTGCFRQRHDREVDGPAD